LLGTLASGTTASAAVAVFGATAGATVGQLIEQFAQECIHRTCGPRELTRIGATLEWALQDVRRRLEAGETIRADNFFDDSVSDRSAATELLEGISRKAQQEHEERKLSYLGRMFASFLFTEEIDGRVANGLLSLADRLNYQQYHLLCIVIFNQSGATPNQLNLGAEAINKLYGDASLYNLTWLLSDMIRLGIILRPHGDDDWLGGMNIIPAHLSSAVIGQMLSDCLGLSSIEKDDPETWDSIVGALQLGSMSKQ
jgi:hypothetical protein